MINIRNLVDLDDALQQAEFHDRDRLLAAAHEAGHAIASVAVGAKVNRVGLLAGEWPDVGPGWGGFCDHAPATSIAGSLQIAIAGPEAELILQANSRLPRSQRRGWTMRRHIDGAAGDEEIIRAILDSIGEQRAAHESPLVQDAREEARKIIEREWTTLLFLAVELFRTESLTGESLRKLSDYSKTLR